MLFPRDDSIGSGIDKARTVIRMIHTIFNQKNFQNSARKAERITIISVL